MLSAIASYERNLLWLAIVQVILVVMPVVLHVSTCRAWQYLIEGQRHRTVEHIAEDIKPGVEVKFHDRQSHIHVRRDLTTSSTGAQGSPPDGGEETMLADVVRLDTYRQMKANNTSWAPPA